MSIRLVPRSDSSSESSSDEEMNREDMRGRGPRRPKKQRDPYSSPFYRHYIVNADQNGPDVGGSVWDQHSELATGFRRRFGLPSSTSTQSTMTGTKMVNIGQKKLEITAYLLAQQVCVGGQWKNWLVQQKRTSVVNSADGTK
eukprot:CAMPEP_0113615208 /NCGR_PEP_ID=MMETSP0017_2-20120614/7581_1 /TAXON_ID=2856 /ORGANISM="Cylindrotheca closterium" /LENGTH=141 /DNA_ID=CAMNT_0000524435 /DNA_START=366 /DNA_END=789 /DNA_ORIENTATION=+ /assembly_acc=CAM_ASM_000147